MEGFAVLHAMAGADDVIENDKLSQGQRIALAQVVANIEETKLVEAIRPEIERLL